MKCHECGERDARDLYRDRDGKVRCVDCGAARDRARERTGD